MKNKRIGKMLLVILFSTLLILNMKTLVFAGEGLTLTASASSTYGSYNSARAVDGNPTTYWCGAKYESPWWIVVDAGDVVEIDELKILWHSSRYATDYNIEVSSDGETWNTLYTGLNGIGGQKYFKIHEELRYVRIYVNAIKAYYPRIHEIELSKLKPVPHKMRFQGKLQDSSESNLDGLFTLSFKIYDVETGGTSLWSETQEEISVENGMLDVVLGSVVDMNLPFDKQYYLGVEVENDGEMSPRFMMTSAPYAFRAEN